jgi:hypothetical protein
MRTGPDGAMIYLYIQLVQPRKFGARQFLARAELDEVRGYLAVLTPWLWVMLVDCRFFLMTCGICGGLPTELPVCGSW